ncbi:ribonuclease HII [Candidatus Undinarchaeota archaeon]
MFIAGVDEAGRGPVIGPMTICCLVVHEDKEKELKELGVKDSKMLTPERRKELRRDIKKIAHTYHIEKVQPKHIDSYRDDASLNEMEAEVIGKLIRKLGPQKVYVDSPDRPPARFANRIRKYLRDPVIIHSHNKAERFPVVAAASILAKVERDRQIEKIKKKYGEVGSGYPSDEITIKYLQEWIRNNKEYPDIVRKSWYTAWRLNEEKVQRKVDDWF